MAGAYWKFGDGTQQPNPLPVVPPAKRARSDYGAQGPEVSAYIPYKDDRAGMGAIRDTDDINASYDRYLKSTQISSFGADAGRSVSSGLSGHQLVDEPRVVGIRVPDATLNEKAHPFGLGGQPEIPLPPDASSTLFVEGLPANCTRREVSHIFRPFVGYKEVRLVMKDSRHPGGDPLVFCFVDFESPAHAATAMVALQGYRFDENDRDSVNLRLQFARHPGARSGGAHRSKR